MPTDPTPHSHPAPGTTPQSPPGSQQPDAWAFGPQGDAAGAADAAGDPAPTPPASRGRRTTGPRRVALVAAVAIAAAATGGVAVAATRSSETPAVGAGQTGPGQTGPGQTGPGQTGPGQTGLGQTGLGQTGTAGGSAMGGLSGTGGPSGVPMQPLHGEFVVSGGSGYVTERMQTGTVTAVSSASITVKSSDGFTATYRVGTASLVSGVSKGDTVSVVATVSGGSVTATRIGSGSDQFGGPPPGSGSGQTNGQANGQANGQGTAQSGTA